MGWDSCVASVMAGCPGDLIFLKFSQLCKELPAFPVPGLPTEAQRELDLPKVLPEGYHLPPGLPALLGRT